MSLVGNQVRTWRATPWPPAPVSLAFVDMVVSTASVTAPPPTMINLPPRRQHHHSTVDLLRQRRRGSPEQLLRVEPVGHERGYCGHGHGGLAQRQRRDLHDHGPVGHRVASPQGTDTVGLVDQSRTWPGNAVAASAGLAKLLRGYGGPHGQRDRPFRWGVNAGGAGGSTHLCDGDLRRQRVRGSTRAPSPRRAVGTNEPPRPRSRRSAHSGNAATYTITAPSGTCRGAEDRHGGSGRQSSQGSRARRAANSGPATFVVNAVTDMPPQVVGVYLSGTAWKPAYLSALGPPAWETPRSVSSWPTARAVGEHEHLRLDHANQVTIVFNKPVNVARGSLGLEDSSNNGGIASGITVAQAAGNSGTTTVTWT